MYRAVLRFLAVLFLTCGVSNADTESDTSILLRVRVTDVAYTDYFPEIDCPVGHECIPFFFWFRYHAKVREVVRGQWPRNSVKFANLQHARYARKPRDWYVLLIPCGESVRTAVGVEYCVKAHAFAHDQAGLERLLGTQPGD